MLQHGGSVWGCSPADAVCEQQGLVQSSKLCSSTTTCMLVRGKEKSKQHSIGTPKASPEEVTSCSTGLLYSCVKQCFNEKKNRYIPKWGLFAWKYFNCISPKPAILQKYSVKLYIRFCSLCNFRKPQNDSEPPSACDFGIGACLLCHVYNATNHLKFSHRESKVRHYYEQSQPEAEKTS